jgi:ABC-2 type transport system permease protein
MSATAFAYLTTHAAKNRFVARIKRAKNPRYALALILGATYLWFVYIRPGSARHTTAGINTTGSTWMVIGTAVLLVMTGVAWFVPNGPSSLAMDKAEMSFILPAPVTRRGLVVYKTVRAQFAILVTVIIWTVLMRRGGTALPLPLRALGVWLFFTTTNLHRTGAEIVRAAWSIRGGRALRKHWVATGAIIAIIIGLGVSLGLAHDSIVDAWHVGIKEAAVAVGVAMRTGPALVALWPIHAVIGPMAAATTHEWLGAMPAALIILAIHIAWVLRVDDEAVEAAVVHATANLEVLRSRSGRSKVAKPSLRPRPDVVLRTMQLSPSGWAPMAIVWKNLLCMRRKTRSALPMLLLIAAVPVVAGVIGGVRRTRGLLELEVVLTIAMAALVVLFGPIIARSDLRDDMLNLTALKLLPLRGRTIVAAEVLSVVLPIAIIEFALLALAAGLMLFEPNRPFTPLQTLGVLAGVLPAVLAFTAAIVGIQNAAPVLFPAWVKLGAITNGGIEAMGQMMIVVALFLVLLAAMLLVPAIATTGIILAGRAHMALAVVGALLFGAAVLAAEVSGLFVILGRTLERTEPSDVAMT